MAIHKAIYEDPSKKQKLFTPKSTFMQSIITNQNQRVYALDALRAIMMLLGIVLHAAITYGIYTDKAVWSLQDSHTNVFFDIIAGFIHSFRMPVFFVAAGFFAALLFYKKGPKAMLVNRVKRIVLPFIAGVLLVFPLVAFAFTFSGEVFANLPTAFTDSLHLITSGQYLPYMNVMHLWFLYFLAIYAVAAWLLGLLFIKPTKFSVAANKVCTIIFKSPALRLLTMMALYFLCLVWMKSEGILTNADWKINLPTLTTYFLFFGTGWMIYRTDTLFKLANKPLWQLGVATVLFLIFIFFPWPEEAWVFTIKQIGTAVYGSLFVYGFLALFLNYFNHPSQRLSYLMDASYWVYIIHLPLVALVPGLIAAWALPAGVKFLVTFAVTAVISMLSYKYFVRGTVIGMFLNGKIHKRKTAPAVSFA